MIQHSDKQLRARVRGIAAALMLGVLSACATASNQSAQIDPKNGDGIGGTGIASQTVLADAQNGDGIGGTGILGTISGFGSIIVNGLELEYDRGTAVETDGRPAALEELKIGQVVLGTARMKGTKLYLDRLEMQHAVTGPIERIDHDKGTLTVLGQMVRTNMAGDKTALESFKTLTTGDMVSVSGLRQADGTVIATRVDQHPDDGRVIVRGTAQNVTAASINVGGLIVPLSKETTVAPVKDGGRVFVSGRVINDVFVADVVVGSAPLPFGEGVKDVSVEAYAPNSAPGTGLTIEGIAIDGASLPAGTAAGDRVVITGQISGTDRITATTIDKVRTFVTILKARGSLRPASIRPDNTTRPERISPPRPERTPERPNIIQRPERERPESGPMV
jgi:Domain of unknown function (DUF5666)